MLEAQQLAFRYRDELPWIVNGIDLDIRPGEIVGLPGPSGRGKSTLAKVLGGYLLPERGSVRVDGAPLTRSGFCPVQLLFQHPELAVNPRWRIGEILGEAEAPPAALLDELGIESAWFERYPHELSGGELQRVCLARAICSKTRYLLCDEMTSMLDALTQAQIWRAILNIVKRRNLGLLVISHDTALIDRLCDRVVPCFADHPDAQIDNLPGDQKDQDRNSGEHHREEADIPPDSTDRPQTGIQL
ncbi:MAG: ATP-binding cassette domain-containing protein [Proteobacteria bacterium]|nr:ATP-binding cassette domain-containing protein [Pseudomonadota bacterium]MBU1641550.1 ATP-binding cassette domain-containing protein [Pseudomonadota bacterium]